jgi:hypothetical protein
MMRTAAALGLALIVSACGTQTQLTPPKGAELPPAPYGAAEKPSADELLRRDALAAPERSVELRRRSEERQDDPFDLPPE